MPTLMITIIKKNHLEWLSFFNESAQSLGVGILSQPRCRNFLRLQTLLWEEALALLFKMNQMEKSIGFKSGEFSGHSRAEMNEETFREPLLLPLTGVGGCSVLLERTILIPEMASSRGLHVLLENFWRCINLHWYSGENHHRRMKGMVHDSPNIISSFRRWERATYHFDDWKCVQ